MTYQLTELQEKWLTALESGEYSQCKEVLHDGKGYCCLGLGAVVAGGKFETDERGKYVLRELGDSENECGLSGLPMTVLRLRGSLGDIAGGSTLAHMNDCGASFAEIAAFIRANPEKVFLP